MSKKISKREFLLYPYKYIKQGEFILTNNNQPEYRVFIKRLAPKPRKEKPEKRRKGSSSADKYRCGCKKVSGHMMCPTHSRL